MDGRFSKDELLYRIQHDPELGRVKENILQVDMLIIDEISMISQQIFEMVEFLCRKLRDGEKTFGGIQVRDIWD